MDLDRDLSQRLAYLIRTALVACRSEELIHAEVLIDEALSIDPSCADAIYLALYLSENPRLLEDLNRVRNDLGRYISFEGEVVHMTWKSSATVYLPLLCADDVTLALVRESIIDHAYERAEKLLRTFEPTASRQAATLMLQGEVDFHLGRYERALQSFQRLLEHEIYWADARLFVARILLEQELYEVAAGMFERLADNHPHINGRRDASYWRATIAQIESNESDERRWLSRCYAIDTTYADVAQRLFPTRATDDEQTVVPNPAVDAMWDQIVESFHNSPDE